MEKKYDFTKAEKAMQDLWAKEGIYDYHRDESKKTYAIDTPPPTVSGRLHIGHVFSYTQAEMIARFRRMQGYNVFYPFGFDDNGLPTERLVEREEKLRAADLPRSEFRKKCYTTALKYEDAFKEMWQSLGFSVDWNQQYQTVSERTQRISQRSFLELVRMGKAYMKESPVLWCTECQTSIAQAELDTKDVDTFFNYLNFPYSDGSGAMLIATTRPELLYGCVCVFVHPEDERYKAYVGKNVRVPLYDYDIPIMTDEAVSLDKGTGAVMCATFGDATDAAWFDKHKLPYRKVILPNGTIDEAVPFIGGKKVLAARAIIIEKLKEAGLLVKQEELTHTVATHERCGKEIEIIPSNQWYIDVLSEKERFLKAADEINWYPAHMKNRYTLWVENLKWDWCISRQRYFGISFPVWYCRDCGKPIFADESQLPVNPMETPPPHACSCGCTEYRPETAVFDTWATSSVTPLINAHFGEPDERMDEVFPMGMRCQAHEIIRTWTFYTIVKSLYHTGKLPWKDVMISGFVLAKPGEKISKSKNNAEASPLKLIEQHSADAIRYWAANARLGTDTFFSDEDLKISKRFLTKLWNASSFAIMHLQDFELRQKPLMISGCLGCLVHGGDDSSEGLFDNTGEIISDGQHMDSSKFSGMAADASMPELLPIDKWMLARVAEVTKRAKEYLYQYEIGQARHEIDGLFWNDFCDDYIELIKERLYQPEKHGKAERASGQYALYHSLLGILKLYAIYVPHITDYIYQQFFRKYENAVSIHSMEWSADSLGLPAEEQAFILEFGESVKALIADVRKKKSEQQLSMRTEIEQLDIRCIASQLPCYRLTEKDLAACTCAKEIKYSTME